MEDEIRIVDAYAKDSDTSVGDEHLVLELLNRGNLSGYPKAKLIAHLEKSLNAFIAKTKKEEVL